jgi:two-component system OmpR family sensor kinase
MSLRTRLIVGLLVLAAAGLVTLAAVTYREQQSFLLDRVDSQARSGIGLISVALDRAGANVPGARDTGAARVPRGGRNEPSEPRPGPPPQQTLPPGTFGQRRDAAGRPLRPNVIIDYGQTSVPTPRLPRHIPVNRLITVGSSGGGGTDFRAFASPTRDQSGTTVIAVPLRDADQTLHRLLLIEIVVVVGVLALLAALAWFVVRLGLRPLDRIAATAGAIAGGDLSRRVEPATERTEVGRLGLALNAMLAQIESAFREREASENRLRRFLADVSHELRTPLTSIRMFVETLQMKRVSSPAEVDACFDVLNRETARLTRRIERLLDWGRMEAGKRVYQTNFESVREVVDAAMQEFDANHVGRREAVAVEIATDLPLIKVDRGALVDALVNLLTNAYKYSPERGNIRLRATADDKHVRIAVIDQGIGIARREHRRIFDKFYRANELLSSDVEGSGLGLAIVRHVVQAHGGRVALESEIGKGSTFTLMLPYPGERGPRALPNSPAETARSSGAPRSEPARASTSSAPSSEAR